MEYMRLKNLFGQPDLNSDQPPMAPQIPANAGIDMPNFASAFQPMQDPSGNVSIGPQQPIVPPAMADPTNEYNVNQRMMQIYHPESMASDRLDSMISNYPQYKEPSKLRKIGGSILGAITDLGTNLGGNRTGISGHSVYDEVTGKNAYREKIGDWKNQIGPAENAAALERNQNVNERTQAYQTVGRELQQQAEKDKVKKTDAETAIRQQRANVYEAKSKNPDLKFDFSGPYVIVTNPKTGEVTTTDVKTAHMSDLDKITLGQTNALARIGATGGEARKTELVKQEGRTALEGIKQPNRLALKGASGVQGEKPTQTRVRQFNSARELFNTNPELRQFIKIGNPGSQDFEVTPPNPSAYFQSNRGPTPEQYKKIQDTIYGSDAVAIGQPTRTGRTPTVGGPPQNGPNLGTAPPMRPGATGDVPRVKIADASGKVIGTIPTTDVAKLDKKLYKVVP